MFYEDFDFETKLASELKNQNKFLMNVVTELRDVTEIKLSLYKYFEQNFVLSNTKINNAKLWQTKKLFAMKVSRIFESKRRGINLWKRKNTLKYQFLM
ncbi:MAG: hypothetical protein IJ361_01640 [Spirochaetaceae bacterium]|nr:hypothetical protein [Spirochaetaceae bacterium]